MPQDVVARLHETSDPERPIYLGLYARNSTGRYVSERKRTEVPNPPYHQRTAWEHSERDIRIAAGRVADQLIVRVAQLANTRDVHSAFNRSLDIEVADGTIGADQAAALQYDVKIAADARGQAAEKTARGLRSQYRIAPLHVAWQGLAGVGSVAGGGALVGLAVRPRAPSGNPTEAVGFGELSGGLSMGACGLFVLGTAVRTMISRFGLPKEIAAVEARAAKWNRISQALNEPREAV